MIEAEHWRLVDPAAWRWRFFAPAELACRGDGRLRIVPEALDMLEAARVAVGRPFHINSAYRSPVYNAMVGGAPRSRHKVGDAFDVSVLGHDREQVLRSCREAGFSGFGFYGTFLHVDARPWRAEWWGTGGRQAWTG